MIELDERGKRCPLPVIALARAIHDIAVSSEIAVLSDDPAAEHDIPAWCRLRGHELVSATEGRFVIRRLT